MALFLNYILCWSWPALLVITTNLSSGWWQLLASEPLIMIILPKFAPFLPNLAPFLEGQIFVQNLTKKGARLDKNFAQIGTFWKVIFFTNLAPFLTNLLAKSHYYFCPILHLFDVHFLPKFAPFFKMLKMSKEAFLWVIELVLKIPKKVWDWAKKLINQFLLK